jgi:hypothetical protein
VAYVLGKLTLSKPYYSITEKEAGAWVFFIYSLRPPIEGDFSAVTDHSALKRLLNLILPHFCLAKWVVEISALAHCPARVRLLHAHFRTRHSKWRFCQRCRVVVALRGSRLGY